MNQSQCSLISIAMAGLLCAGMAGLPLSFGQSSIPLQGEEPLPAVVVGAMAPPLSVETWVKNADTIGVSKDGALSFKKGQVYLIEFWGTRCGPCMESLPHLQEFQDAYPKGLTIVAVSIREGEPDSDDFVAAPQRVKDFIAKYLKHATFAIAMDGAKQEADRQWMLGGELEAIPTAFLIDQEGRIAFIGHPLSPSLEATLSALMRGKFDLEAAAKKYRSLLVERRLMKKARGLAEAGDLDTAIAIMDQLVAMAPNWDRAVALEKFQMLMEAKQFERAFSTAETIIAQPTRAVERASTLRVALYPWNRKRPTKAWTLPCVPPESRLRRTSKNTPSHPPRSPKSIGNEETANRRSNGRRKPSTWPTLSTKRTSNPS